MKVTIDMDEGMVNGLKQYLDQMEIYKSAGFSGEHPTDVILRALGASVDAQLEEE